MTNLPVDLVLYDMGQFLSLEMSLDCSSGSDVINTELRPGKGSVSYLVPVFYFSLNWSQ